MTSKPSSIAPSVSVREAYFRQLCETLGVALAAAGADLRICVWNAAAARVFGAGSDRMIGATLASIIPQCSRKVAERLFHNALDRGEVGQFGFDHRDLEGRQRELAATVAPVVTEEGERIGVSVCFRDITDRIALQRELAQTQKMAALGEMAGAVAHHFNNILGGIITRLDYAVARADRPEYVRMVEPVSKALGRAMALVEGLVAFSEGDRRTDDLADLTEVVRIVSDEVEQAVREHGITFTLSLPKLPETPVPRRPVLTILRNIARNAVEAMPQGGTLRLDVALQDDYAVIRINDSGTGLTAEDRTRIFEPFWTTKGVLAEGTGRAAGMGLAVAHGLTQMLGGSIAVESQAGVGSTFTVRIPRSEPS